MFCLHLWETGRLDSDYLITLSELTGGKRESTVLRPPPSLNPPLQAIHY
jgi:hypothetical protein